MRILILFSRYSASLALACLFLNISANAEETAQSIMDRVDSQQRMVANSTLSKSTLSSCEFALKDKKAVCSETPREKIMETVTRQLGTQLKDSQSISIILEPASESGIGMLTYSYEDDDRDTESWLYLSALGKVKRMASGTGEDQEPVSLFGSEFTTEDMESGKTDEYRYEILQSGQYSGRLVWVIEAKPLPRRYRKTNYSKLLYWVDQERMLPLKVQAYDKRGQLHKRIMFKRHEKINDLWMSRNITIYNLKKMRLSIMDTVEIAMNVGVDPEFLTQRTLTDFAFRERILQDLRQSIQ